MRTPRFLRGPVGEKEGQMKKYFDHIKFLRKDIGQPQPPAMDESPQLAARTCSTTSRMARTTKA
jgi:hypothetical protein